MIWVGRLLHGSCCTLEGPPCQVKSTAAVETDAYPCWMLSDSATQSVVDIIAELCAVARVTGQRLTLAERPGASTEYTTSTR